MNTRLTISANDNQEMIAVAVANSDIIAARSEALLNWLFPVPRNEFDEIDRDEIDYDVVEQRCRKFSMRYRLTEDFKKKYEGALRYLLNKQEQHGWFFNHSDAQGIAFFMLCFIMETGPCAWNSRTERHFGIVTSRVGDEFDGFRDYFTENFMHYCSYHDDYTFQDVSYIEGYDDVCESCLDNYFTYSNYEGEWLHNDSAREALDENGDRVTVSENNDDFYWSDEEDCYVHQDFSSGGGYIGDYHSSKRRMEFVDSPWTKLNKRFLGVELEVEVKDGDRGDKAKAIAEWQENNLEHTGFFFERDGSLDCGFEMVSNPMGLDKHRETWKWVSSDRLISGLRSHNTSTCGLHVHVNRTSLTRTIIDRAVFFLNRPANEKLIKTIARRYGAGYAKQKSKALGKCHTNPDRDRYEMLNLCNRETIEFRIFKGTLKYDSIMACIEFCHALLEFCAVTSNQELTDYDFVHHLCKPEMMSDTKHLRQYLASRNSDYHRILAVFGGAPVLKLAA